LGEDIVITIEFEKPKNIKTISTRFYNGKGQWIYAPNEIGFSFYLEDGKTVNDITILEEKNNLLVNYSYEFKSTAVKKLDIIVKNYGTIPEGKQGAGHKAWTFIDEIIIE